MTYQLGQGQGPLAGTKIVELAGIGPSPHACMILADLGADVIRVDRPGGGTLGGGKFDFLTRGRPSVAIDIKHPEGVETILRLCEGADVLIEGMRPGAAERLGVGPEQVHARNPRLVYGRMTGWGQTGPLAQVAGHDMNYVSLTGALYGLGQDPARPHFPSNLLGDFGGGSTYLVIGILAALLHARSTGEGQVIDAAIVDGTAHVNAMGAALLAAGLASERRRSGLLDGGMPFYDLYETADGRHMSVGPLEPQFWAEFCRLLPLPDDAPDRRDLARSEELRTIIADRFRTRTMAEWTEAFEGTEACVAPVLTVAEAAVHPHMAAREVFVERDGALQPAPAPRFSRTTTSLTTGPTRPGQHSTTALADWGIDDVESLIESGAVVQVDA